MRGAAVFQRRRAVFFAEHLGKFALVRIAHLRGDLGDGEARFGQQGDGPFQAQLQQIGRQILPIHAAKIVFQARLADREPRRQRVGGDVPRQVGGDERLGLLGDGDL